MDVQVVVKNENSPAFRVFKFTELVGTFFAGGLLLVNLKEWTKYKEESSNSVFLHPVARLINDFAALVASMERNKHFGQEAITKLYTRLDKSLIKHIYALTGLQEPIGIESVSGRGLQLSKYLTLKNVGRFANILGVVIAYQQGMQALRTGDTAAKHSAIMAGGAEVSFFLSTFAYTGFFVGVGVVLAIGAVLVSMVSDNEFEQWVRTGFWGNSGEYWGKRRLELLKRFEVAGRLLSLEQDSEVKEIKIFFEKEMEGFYNLVWGISIDTILANQYQLKVYCPAFNDKSSVDKLTVEISIMDYTSHFLSTMGNTIPTPMPIPTNNVRKQFLREGEILIDMTQISSLRNYRYVREIKGENAMNTLTVKIKHPKLGEDISTFWRKLSADYFESEITYTGVK
ncbi:hypothetical protein BKL49_09165 [Rodentibacter myodis]|uniref:Uncharacterized protein n=1 Tax=Rodentibacter myodis TaxID=1907939 RepID=A0A1V3JLQ8_9PAST|nr:hypothetical protein BKL49_09165 [Rodentibacter myodis]